MYTIRYITLGTVVTAASNMCASSSTFGFTDYSELEPEIWAMSDNFGIATLPVGPCTNLYPSYLIGVHDVGSQRTLVGNHIDGHVRFVVRDARCR